MGMTVEGLVVSGLRNGLHYSQEDFEGLKNTLPFLSTLPDPIHTLVIKEYDPAILGFVPFEVRFNDITQKVHKRQAFIVSDVLSDMAIQVKHSLYVCNGEILECGQSVFSVLQQRNYVTHIVKLVQEYDCMGVTVGDCTIYIAPRRYKLV